MKQLCDEKAVNIANLLQMPVIRLECINPERNHYKYYEIETEPALFFPKITRRWGRISCNRPRILRIEHQTCVDYLRDLSSTLRKRFNHGYTY